jgi:nicotinate phosphoribosyltransferase
LDEFKIEELLANGARIDSFGVGTKMGTSADRPYLDVIYKLCETMTANGCFSPIMKLSKDKITLPGRKQVHRLKDAEGDFEKDTIALADEKVDGEPLLVKVMEKGKLTCALPSLDQIRGNAAQNLSKLPDEYKALTGAPVYPVELSRNLLNLVKTLKRQLTINEINHVSPDAAS